MYQLWKRKEIKDLKSFFVDLLKVNCVLDGRISLDCFGKNMIETKHRKDWGHNEKIAILALENVLSLG